MFIQTIFAVSLARSIISFFVRFGFLGPFLLEALDSSFLYLPLANELLLTALITSRDGGLMWVVYALMASLGSVAGVTLLDLLTRKVGEEGLEKFVKPRRIKWIKTKIEKHSGWVVFVTSALPPPFPFRPIIMTASALQSPRRAMLVSVFFGRLLRFTAESLLILYFGRRLLTYMDSEAFEYVIYGLTAAGIIGSILSARKWLLSKKAHA
ncbi:MAG: VTT domain-containing protein [Pyrinomonadaceae bacterium]